MTGLFKRQQISNSAPEVIKGTVARIGMSYADGYNTWVVLLEGDRQAHAFDVPWSGFGRECGPKLAMTHPGDGVTLSFIGSNLVDFTNEALIGVGVVRH